MAFKITADQWVQPECGEGDRDEIRLTFWKSLAEKTDIPVVRLAVGCGLSACQLAELSDSASQMSRRQWVTKCRISLAKDMLTRGYRVARIASDLGYKQTSHFCQIFKKTTGMTPLEYAASRVEHDVKRRSSLAASMAESP